MPPSPAPTPPAGVATKAAPATGATATHGRDAGRGGVTTAMRLGEGHSGAIDGGDDLPARAQLPHHGRRWESPRFRAHRRRHRSQQHHHGRHVAAHQGDSPHPQPAEEGREHPLRASSGPTTPSRQPWPR